MIGGILVSTIGAGMQSLIGAPRLLQAMSKDRLMPIIKPFEEARLFPNSKCSKPPPAASPEDQEAQAEAEAVKTAALEPHRALALTWSIAIVLFAIGDVDGITPLLSMFFLLYAPPSISPWRSFALRCHVVSTMLFPLHLHSVVMLFPPCATLWMPRRESPPSNLARRPLTALAQLLLRRLLLSARPHDPRCPKLPPEFQVRPPPKQTFRVA